MFQRRTRLVVLVLAMPTLLMAGAGCSTPEKKEADYYTGPMTRPGSGPGKNADAGAGNQADTVQQAKKRKME